MRSRLPRLEGVGKRVRQALGTGACTAAPRRRAGRRGQAFVELALILPVIMILLMGVLDLGPVFYRYEAIANGAREAARQCAITKSLSSSQLGTIASNEAGAGITLTALAFPPCDALLVGGTPVRVTVSEVYQPVTGFFPSLTLKATATMVVWQ
jgi:Flp pilus assembly protein TadG